MLHQNRNPRVTIIMPCYNHGKYIDEALQSIDNIEDKNLYEVIIVNDGSTDTYTIERLAELSKTDFYKIIHQENQGTCVAKNRALDYARGEFILPVDADNKLNSIYITEALKIFDNNKYVDVVYSDYHLFGLETGIRISGTYNLQRLMLYNFIENCSMFRKKIIPEIGDYDVYLSKMGLEDWEFWLRTSFAGYKFYYINQPLFYYRVLDNSRTTKLLANKLKSNIYTDYLITKFGEYYGQQFVDDYFLNKFKPNFLGFLFKIILMLYFPKRFIHLVEKGKFRKYL